MIGMIHADNPDTDRMPTSSAELSYLLNQITDHSVDLLDHRLGKNLHLGTNFDGGNGTSCAHKPRHPLGGLVWDQLAKRSVAATGLDAVCTILHVQDALTRIDPGVQGTGESKLIEIVGQIRSYRIAEARVAMAVPRPFKQAPKAVQQ